jgi:hypothetical protein
MKFRLVLIILMFILSACQSSAGVYPEGSTVQQDVSTPFPTRTPIQGAGTAAVAEQVEIDGKIMTFDQVIHGHLCNNTLSGKVYVARDVVVAEWSGKPTFLDDCDFVVEPGTVVYVAAHNNTAYYKGCVSCHARDK